MENAIRASEQPGSGQFLYVDLPEKTFKLCCITARSHAQVEYSVVASHTKAPLFRAFDWSPVNELVVVVGQSSGEATLLKLDDGRQDSVSFPVRHQRQCNTVALSTQNLLAAGLDKVRTDFCLNIWDIQHPVSATSAKGFSNAQAEPLHKLAGSEPITSVRFFRDDPQSLVAGVKGQFVRLYDLREPGNVQHLQFATRCVHNLAIDPQDENYFASCFPTSDTAICVWDRRMLPRFASPHVSVTGTSQPDRQSEASLELKGGMATPDTIWRLGFSKTSLGCLGVLSKRGHCRLFDIRKEFVPDPPIGSGSHTVPAEPDMKAQSIYLNRSYDIEQAFSIPNAYRDEAKRIVSFDFMSSQTSRQQPEIIMLTGDQRVEITCPPSPAVPASFSSLGFFSRGETERNLSIAETGEVQPPTVGSAINGIRRRAEPRNSRRQTFKQTKQNKALLDLRRMSSYANFAWNQDLGYFEKEVRLQELLTLSSVYRLRCEAGYMFSAAKNRAITTDSHWLQTFWGWVERAARLSRAGFMTQDNFDLSYIGVHGLWMEDFSLKSRMLGPSSSKMWKIIEILERRLNVAGGRVCTTEYSAHRHLCLYISGLAWSYEELEAMVRRLIAQNQHAKAAAMAVFADERKLAYMALRHKTATQSHKMLAMAIAGAPKQFKLAAGDVENESEGSEDWSETIVSLAEELVDPYARAILALVKSGDWNAVVQEESLPLKYRLAVALRWLSDSALTSYLARITREAISNGDIEAIILTGTGTDGGVELLGNYITKFGDVQTAVLALSSTVPRYVDHPVLVRRFQQWRETYRELMNSWGLKFERVRFDIGSQKLAVDSSGRKLTKPVRPQVALVCNFCTQSLAQFGHFSDPNAEETDGNRAFRETPGPIQKYTTSERAAAKGTVCPKCERHLPRCGVCDLWLGSPDPSHLRWYAPSIDRNGSMDLSASLTGSATTIIGPHPSVLAPQSVASSAPAAGGGGGSDEARQDTSSAMRDWEEMLRKVTVFCIKCRHGFHAHHAKQWFGGYGGRAGHKVCPVSTCQCVCDTS